jgi:Icc-related predicted phosphoesterase
MDHHLKKGATDKISGKLTVDRLKRCLLAIKKHLSGTGIKCLVSPRNNDYCEIQVLNGKSSINGDDKVFNIGEIEEWRRLGLNGYIHESREIVKIGHTVCLKPGSKYPEGVLIGVLLNVAD